MISWHCACPMNLRRPRNSESIVSTTHLAGKRLGARHADLRPRVQINPAVRLPGDRAADRVHDPQAQRALFLPFAQRRQRVGCFTRLADGDQHGSVFDNRIPIAELGRVGAFGNDLRQVFQKIISQQTGMPRGSLRGEDNPPRLQQLAAVVRQSTQDDPPLLRLGSPAQAIASPPSAARKSP